MKRTIVTIACLTFASAMFAATTTVNVGGESMWSNRTIVNNAVNSADHTTLVTALKAAGLVDTLQGAGPFTVFAPTNAAFDRLPEGTVNITTYDVLQSNGVIHVIDRVEMP